MILTLILAAWLLVLTIVTALCVAADRGDTALSEASSSPGRSPERDRSRVGHLAVGQH